MASTCSNYGRMADPTVPVDRGRRARARLALRRAEGGRREDAARRSTRRRSRSPACASPPSTASRRGCASTSPSTSSRATCGRTAGSRCSASSSGARTCTSATPRAASAPCSRRRPRRVAGEVFNVGDTARELPQARPRRADPPRRPTAARSRSSSRTEDPRDYKVAFEQDRATGSATRSRRRSRTGIGELIAALDDARFEDAFDGRYRNIRLSTVPLFDLRLEPEDIGRSWRCCESGWLTMGPRTQAFEAAFAEHLGARHAVARLLLHGRAAPRLPGRRRRARATR